MRSSKLKYLYLSFKETDPLWKALERKGGSKKRALATSILRQILLGAEEEVAPSAAVDYDLLSTLVADKIMALLASILPTMTTQQEVKDQLTTAIAKSLPVQEVKRTDDDELADMFV